MALFIMSPMARILLPDDSRALFDLAQAPM